MKIVRYTLLIILSLVLLNLITYFLIGKQSLRERNLSEMTNTEFYFVNHDNSVFPLISNLNLGSKYVFNGYEYPVFYIAESSDSISTIRNYSDSLLSMQYISLDIEEAETLLSIKFEDFEIHEIDSLVSENYMTLINSVKDSLVTLPKLESYRADCGFYFHIRCRVYQKWSNHLYEEIKVTKLFYVHQLLEFKLFLNHTPDYREEKLIWLFYRWVQIKWISGNGLGSDATS